ncbi:ankyrin [Byssothecium circinans]|uniref:Ankyrin n=1 Tax=Byssothecium circinans TaxID=147558 RepID=A0A6A5TZH9_9PLEO|nr:ankyrin [Byssothecium circinans]
MDPTAQYIPYFYNSLPRGNKDIRLLRLLPNKKETATLQCQLFNYSLEPDSHQYDALSYVWGDPNETLPILIDENVFYITENLHAALLRIRDHSLERIIWVDAVCINQDDEEEKGYQIQYMARIYGQANRVIVWLGKEEDDSNQALEIIRSVAEDGSINVANNQKAVLGLLQRPWFERIWVLQEVAAARHVLIMCGSAEIDGYPFCLGLESLMNFYETRKDLQGVIRSITYLVKGAIFRPKYATSKPSMGSLNICPLGELIDMYHTHKATKLHDKVYALLGMSSVDGGRARLSPNYEVSWEKLLQQLIEFLLHEQVSVETGPGKQMAVIRSKGCILGQVSSVKNYITRESKQNLDVSLKMISEQLGHSKRYDTHWMLKSSAKQIREGDIVCLLQGAARPVIVRPCGDYFAVIRISVFPENKPTKSRDIEWSNLLQALTVFPHDFLLVWDWTENSDFGEYGNLVKTNDWMSGYSKSELESHLDKATRMWNCALILEDLKEYKEAEVRLRKAIESYDMVLGEVDMHTVESRYSRTPLSCAAWNWCGPVVNARTLLWLAARGGYKIVVKLLLETDKVDVDPKDKNSQTPLSWTAKHGHEAIVKLLLGTGKADVHSKDKDGRTPLSWAAEGGHLAIVELLLQEKANVNAPGAGYKGRTALQAAAGGGHLAVVERLLKEKAKVNASAAVNDGRTALQAAAGGGHLDVVERLLQEKADVISTSSSGCFKRRPTSMHEQQNVAEERQCRQRQKEVISQ